MTHAPHFTGPGAPAGRRLPPFLVAAALLLASCATPRPKEESTVFRYRHTYGFLFEQAEAELAEEWPIERSDREAGEIVTGWDTQLAPMNTFGRRHRLTVRIERDPLEGHRVIATQETEMNTQQMNPLSADEADWEPMQSDGGLAQTYLVKLHRRLNPPKDWKDDGIR